MQNIDLFKLIFMAAYAAGVTVASFYFFFAIVFNKVPEDNAQYANLILGFLIGSGIPTFLGYYFGMSQSTKARTPMDMMPPNGSHTQTLTEMTTLSKTDQSPDGCEDESKIEPSDITDKEVHTPYPNI